MTNDTLQKYIKGEALEAEREEVTLWLMESPDNLKRYRTERKMFEALLWQEADSDAEHAASDAEYAASDAAEIVTQTEKTGKTVSEKNKTISVRYFFHEFMKVAAVVAVTLIAVTWFTNDAADELMAYQEMVVPAGQRAELNLADGTKVWLNSGSTLTFPTSFSGKERNVRLDGEGYFEVTKNAASPFVVETSKGNIRVLGTEFNVMAYAHDDEWETSLLKGSVEVFRPETNEVLVRLEPNTKVTIQNDAFVKDDIGETNRFLWREGLLCFSNISVEEMLDKVALYYGVDIEVRQKQLLNKKYTGKFRTKDGVEHVLKVLRLNHNFRYLKNDDKNTIVIY